MTLPPSPDSPASPPAVPCPMVASKTLFRSPFVLDEEKLVKGKYSVEFVGNDKKKVLWEVVGDHVVEEPCDQEDIGLRGFNFNIFDEDEEGVVRK